jgi:hypothetical protein
MSELASLYNRELEQRSREVRTKGKSQEIKKKFNSSLLFFTVFFRTTLGVFFEGTTYVESIEAV